MFLRFVGEANHKDRPVAEITPPSHNTGKKEESFKEMMERTLLDMELSKKRDDRVWVEGVGKKAKPRKKGVPSGVLDLHACTLEAALSLTEQFLIRAHAQKQRMLLVIHGKGSGVLLNGVRKYLMQHPFVLRLEDAPRHLGGSGAAVVFLRN